MSPAHNHQTQPLEVTMDAVIEEVCPFCAKSHTDLWVHATCRYCTQPRIETPRGQLALSYGLLRVSGLPTVKIYTLGNDATEIEVLDLDRAKALREELDVAIASAEGFTL